MQVSGKNIEKNTIDIIGYDCGWGCGDFRCEDGPHKLPLDQIIHALSSHGYRTKYAGPLGIKFLGDHKEYDTKDKTLPHVITALRRLTRAVRDSAETGHIPVVIGGDHSSAIGTFSGMTSATKSHGHYGLIWIDAHLDSHTYETSWQGKFGGWWHGQPVAALCGYGLPGLTSIGSTMAKINPKNLTLIGPHSFEPAEEEFVRKHNIRVIGLDEVKQRGFDSAFAEAVARATNGTKNFGMTIDLDAFQPSDSPGVGAAEERGLAANSVLPIIRSIGRHPAFSALEIVEFNPHKDINNITARLITSLLENIFAESSSR